MFQALSTYILIIFFFFYAFYSIYLFFKPSFSISSFCVSTFFIH